MPRPEPELTAREAANLLGVHISRIYQLLDQGLLKRAPDGGGITFKSTEDFKANRRPAGRPRRTK